MKVGLYDVDSHNFPNLAIMKISAWHKAQGDSVEWCFPLKYYDRVYVSKVFGDEYSQINTTCLQADEVKYGGTGFAIKVENGKELYQKEIDKDLPSEIEHIYPDYDLYPDLTKDAAFGFLTRGCPNACGFCLVCKKEGRCSNKVANLTEFWNGQKNIKLLDPNLLACQEHEELLKQLVESMSNIDFTQGLDARFINEDNVKLINQIRIKSIHFAFDLIENEQAILKGLELYKKNIKETNRCGDRTVYIITNYNTTFEQDWYRVAKVRELGFYPFLMIYRKPSAPKLLKHLQRWCNNKFLLKSCDFKDYQPNSSGKTIKEMYDI